MLDFGAAPLSALCPLWKIKERSQEKSEGSKSFNSRNERLDFYLSYRSGSCSLYQYSYYHPYSKFDGGKRIGDAQLSSFVLSIMQLIGIVAGVSFSFLISIFKEKLLLWSGITFGLGQIVIALSSSLWVVVAGSVLAGFAYSVVLTTVFQLVSERIPAKLLNQATSFAVLGCSFEPLRPHSF